MKWYKRVGWDEVRIIILAVLVVRLLLLALSVGFNIPWYMEYGAAILVGAYAGFRFRMWKVNNDSGRTSEGAEGD